MNFTVNSSTSKPLKLRTLIGKFVNAHRSTIVQPHETVGKNVTTGWLWQIIVQLTCSHPTKNKGFFWFQVWNRLVTYCKEICLAYPDIYIYKWIHTYITNIHTNYLTTCSSHNKNMKHNAHCPPTFFHLISNLNRSENLNLTFPTPIGSMGLAYLPTWMVDFYGKCRQIYMDPMGTWVSLTTLEFLVASTCLLVCWMDLYATFASGPQHPYNPIVMEWHGARPL